MNFTKITIVFLAVFSFYFSFFQHKKPKYLIFGKGNKYYPQFNDVEKKIDKTIFTAYTSILPPELEIPINKFFESDSCVTFIGVSFKYSIRELLDSLNNFGEVLESKKVNEDSFFQQAKVGKNTITRLVFYSTKDHLTYLINLIFIHHTITIDEFESIMNKYLKR